MQEKERGSRSASRSSHTVPQCGAGQRVPGFWTGDQCGGTFWGAGVRFDPRVAGTARRFRIFRGSKRGYAVLRTLLTSPRGRGNV